MRSSDCVYLFFLIAFFIDQNEAVRCYVCNSKYDVSCGDPFFPVNVPLINCDAKLGAQYGTRSNMCKKITSRVEDGTYHVIRDCANLDSTPVDGQMCITQPGGNFNCRCFGDACNRASSEIHSWIFVTILVALTTVFYV